MLRVGVRCCCWVLDIVGWRETWVCVICCGLA